jgi:very-short-patch-repair endonuclease
MSMGERQIESWLKSNNIDYKTQYKVEGCKNKKPLSYDFFIPDKNLLIEYQGIQHYQPVEIFGGEENFKKQQENDKIKKRFAFNNGYELLEIKYTDNVLDKLTGVFGGGS